MSVRHFTDLSTVSEGDLRSMLDDAVVRKARLKAGERPGRSKARCWR